MRPEAENSNSTRLGRVKPHQCLHILFLVGLAFLPARGAQASASGSAKPPYNIIFIISDQKAGPLLVTGDYDLPARAELKRHGVDFQNHYIASAMCTPSRAAFLSGQPPQVNGVFDQMELGYVPNLRPDMPNMGSVLKGLGYATAYFGKFEMNRELLKVNPSVNYHAALQPYGFDFFNLNGDRAGAPDEGYHGDRFYSAKAVTLKNHAS